MAIYQPQRGSIKARIIGQLPNPVPLHEMTDAHDDLQMIELPDGSFMRKQQYDAQVRIEAKRAAHAFEKARAARRASRYNDEALF